MGRLNLVVVFGELIFDHEIIFFWKCFFFSDFITQVPSDLLPPIFPPGEDEEVAHHSDLYHKLLASTARSAALANRLAEMHRTNGSDDNDDEEDDYEPQTEEDSAVQGATSPDIVSEIASEDNVEPNDEDVEEEEDDYDDHDDDSEELEDLGLTPEAIEEALKASGRQFDDSNTDDEDDDDTTSLSVITDSEDSEAANELARFQAPSPPRIPDPPPPPSFSLIPPPATVTVRPTFNYANIDSADSSDEDNNDDDHEEASENATAVTRFLIKHFPKQLAKLRHEKSELEDKIRDLDSVISNQNVAMSEMERRIEVYKIEAETARKWSANLANLHHIKVNSNARIDCRYESIT